MRVLRAGLKGKRKRARVKRAQRDRASSAWQIGSAHGSSGWLGSASLRQAGRPAQLQLAGWPLAGLKEWAAAHLATSLSLTLCH